MPTNWTPASSNIALSVRFADLAVRTRRLMVAKQIRNIQNLLKIHAPTLEQIPNGIDTLKKVEDEIHTMLKALQGEDDSHGK